MLLQETDVINDLVQSTIGDQTVMLAFAGLLGLALLYILVRMFVLPPKWDGKTTISFLDEKDRRK